MKAYGGVDSNRVFRGQAYWTLTHTSHKDTEQSTIEASITFDGVILTDSLIRWSGIYQCPSIRYSGRLISQQNEHLIDPHFLDLGISWRWVVSFTPLLLYLRGKSLRYPLYGRLGGPQSLSGQHAEEKILNSTGTRTPTLRSSST
jgi:hypothetical protein